MLEEYKSIYEESANKISNWRKINKSELCRQYLQALDSDNPLSENLVAAIICRYWSSIEKYHFKSSGQLTENECYDCLIDTIDYMTKNRIWENPEHSLYMDPNAPDKLMNKKLFHSYCTMLQVKNRYKHKSTLPMFSISTSDIEEEADIEIDSEQESMLMADELINSYYHMYDYSASFLLYIIVYHKPFRTQVVDGKSEYSISISMIKDFFKNPTEEDYKVVAKIVNDEYNVVKSLFQLHKSLTSAQVKEIIGRNIDFLKTSKFFKERVTLC